MFYLKTLHVLHEKVVCFWVGQCMAAEQMFSGLFHKLLHSHSSDRHMAIHQTDE